MGEHAEGSVQIVAIEQAVLSCCHDALHCAADLCHGKLDDLYGIKALRSLVQLLEVLDVLHAIVLELVYQR